MIWKADCFALASVDPWRIEELQYIDKGSYLEVVTSQVLKGSHKLKGTSSFPFLEALMLLCKHKLSTFIKLHASLVRLPEDFCGSMPPIQVFHTQSTSSLKNNMQSKNLGLQDAENNLCCHFSLPCLCILSKVDSLWTKNVSPHFKESFVPF